MEKKEIVKTYGISILIIVFHIVLAISLHSTLGTDSFYSTFIADIVMLFFCGGQYVTLKSKNKGSDFLEPRFEFSFKKSAIVLAAMAVFIYFALTAMLYITVMTQDPNMAARSDEYAVHNGFIVTFFTVVLAPITEEIIYRLYIYNNVKRVSGWFPATIFSSFLFAVQHMTIAHTVVATAFGIMLCLIYEYTGRRLGVTILCHMLFNAMTLVLPTSALFYSNNIVAILSIVIVFAYCVFGINYIRPKLNEIAPKTQDTKKHRKSRR